MNFTTHYIFNNTSSIIWNTSFAATPASENDSRMEAIEFGKVTHCAKTIIT